MAFSRIFGVLLAILVLIFSTGCAGKQQITKLESELAECQDARNALQQENGKLQESNARLQAQVEEEAKLAAARKKLYQDLRNQLKALIEAGTLELTIRNGLITLQLPNKVLFDAGKAEVKEEARATLVEVANALKNVKDRRFFVTGHTDSQPIKAKADKFKDNWDLSTERAYEVHAVLSSAGVPGKNLAIAGLADTDPVAEGDSPEAMAENRRIEIMVMPDLSIVLPAVAQKGKPQG